MPPAVGPHDGRKARRKRCNACVKRKIKCHGGVPCHYCERTKQPCTMPTRPTNSALIFIGETTNSEVKNRRNTGERSGFSLVKHPSQRAWDLNIPYFFTLFLPMNGLMSDRLPATCDLLNMVKDAPALRAAISAVASHHCAQQDPTIVSRKRDSTDVLETLQSYGQSVRYIQNLIASNTFLEDPSALWTTFLLGVFELMRDSTGTQWLSHFLHGTCAILRLQDPRSLTKPGIKNSQRRTFFLSSRIFEITRSLIYSSPTFLWEPEWKAAIAKLWDGKNIAFWHPMEALLDILPSFSELGIRALPFALNSEQLLIEEQYALAQSLADEGFRLQEKLRIWWENTKLWEMTCQVHGTSSTMSYQPENELMISYAYYHAINIYLSGTYDYHTVWSRPGAPSAPILPQDEIDMHVHEILQFSHKLLANGVSGIFLFFPLRVAGARAKKQFLRNDIVNLFQETSNRGFVVAEALTVDLSELWCCSEIEEDILNS